MSHDNNTILTCIFICQRVMMRQNLNNADEQLGSQHTLNAERVTHRRTQVEGELGF